MKNVMRRALSMFVCVVMLLTSIPAWAEQDDTIQILQMVQDIKDSAAGISESEDPAEAELSEDDGEMIVTLQDIAAELEEVPAEEPVEEPTEAPAEEPVEEPTEAPAEEPVEEPTEAPAEEPVEEPTEAPAEEPVEEPTEAPVEEPAEVPAEEAEEVEITLEALPELLEGGEGEEKTPEQQLEEAYQTIVGNMPADLESAYEKALYLYGELIAAATPGDGEDAYAALLGEGANSMGYAEAYAALLAKARFAAEDIAVITGEDGAWNQVFCDGAWMHVDAYADDVDDRFGRHFGLSDAAMELDGYAWEGGEATGTAAVSYYEYEKGYEAVAKNDDLGNLLAEAANEGLDKLLIYDIGGIGLTANLINSYILDYDLDLIADVAIDGCMAVIKFYDSYATAIEVSDNRKTVTIAKGQKVSFADFWTTEPEGSKVEGEVTYTTKSSSIASVDKATGVVTGKKNGTTYIYVSAPGLEKQSIKVVVKTKPSKLAISNAPAAMGLDEELQLKTAFTSSSAASFVKFSSSDPDTLHVTEDGYLTAKAISDGPVTITVESPSLDSLKAEVQIEVKERPTELILAEEDQSREMGKSDSWTLPVRVNEGAAGKIVFESDNSKVTVDASGKIKVKSDAKTDATATITARVEYAEEVEPVTCEITVFAAPTSVKLKAARTTIGVDEKLQLMETTSLNSTSARTTLTYSSSKEAVAKVDKVTGELEAKAPGSATITVKTHNGKKATLKITVKAAPETVDVTTEDDRTEIGVGEQLKVGYAIPSGTAAVVTVTVVDSDGLTTIPEGAYTFEDGVLSASETGKITLWAEDHRGTHGLKTIEVKEAPTSLSLNINPEDLTEDGILELGQGDTYQLAPELGEGEAGKISYGTTKSANVSVSAAGKIKGVKSGKTETISAWTYLGKSTEEEELPMDSVTVKVFAAPTSVKMNPARKTVGVGEKLQLMEATKLNSTSARTTLTYTSSKEEVAKVDKYTGELEAMAPGSATITVKTHNGKKASFKLTVKDAPETVDVTTENDRTEIGVGEGLEIGYAIPSDTAAVVNVSILETDIPEEFYTFEDGEFSAGATGTVTFEAVDHNGTSGTKTIYVKDAPTAVYLNVDEGEYLNENGELELGLGNTFQLKAWLNEDEAGEIFFKSSNKSYVSVDATGKIKAVKSSKNTYTITAYTYLGSDEEMPVATVPVKVVAAPTKVTLTTARKTIGVGEVIEVAANVTPTSGQTTLTFGSGASNVAEIIEQVEDNVIAIEAKEVGRSVISVKTHNSKKASFTLTVAEAPTMVEVVADRDVLGVGEKLALGYEVDNYGTAYLEVTEGNAEIIDGELIAYEEGAVTVTATTHNDVPGSREFTILPAPEYINLGIGEEDLNDESILELGQNDTYQLQAEVNEGAAGKIYYESSAPKVASVDANGKIKAVAKSGTATITAFTYEDENGEPTASESVDVAVFAAPSKVTLSTERKTVGVGEEIAVKATPNTGKTTLTFKSSKTDIAEISEIVGNICYFNIKKVGRTSISVKTHNGKTASFTLTVKAAPAEVEISADRIELAVGETAELSHKFPEKNVVGTVAYYTEDDDVLEQTGAKEFKAVAPGTATVIGHTQDEEVADEIEITVVPAPAEIIPMLNGEELGWNEVDGIYEVDVRVSTTIDLDYDTDQAEGEKVGVMTFTTEDKTIASISDAEAGKIKGAKANKSTTVRISYAADPEVYVDVRVNVCPNPTSVAIGKEVTTLVQGETYDLKHSFSPDNAMGTVTYSTSKSSVVKIDDNAEGIVTAGATGTATITATTHNGKKSTLKITVIGKPAQVTNLKVDQELANSLTLTWDKAKNAEFYNVYVYDENEPMNDGWYFLDEVTDTTYTATELVVGEEYKFMVEAGLNSRIPDADKHFAAGTVSEPRTVVEQVEVTSVAADAEGRKAYAGDEITWTAAAAAGMKPYSYAFTLYKGDEKVTSAAAGAENTASFVISETGDYTVEVVVTDAYGKKATGESEAITILPLPGKPEITGIAQPSMETASLKLDWTAVEGADFYRVYDLVDGDWHCVAEKVEAETYTVTGLTSGNEYKFAVAACVNTFTQGVKAGAKSDAVSHTVVFPLKVTAITTDAEKIFVGDTATWTAAVEGGKAPYQYVFKAGLNNGVLLPSIDAANNASCTYTVADAGNHVVLVQVTDAYGNKTTFAAEFTALALPEQVTGLTVAQSDKSAAAVILSWEAVENADSYKVYVKNGEAWKQIAETDKTTAEITEGLDFDESYIFAVSACAETFSNGEYESEKTAADAFTVVNALTVTGISCNADGKKAYAGDTLVWTASVSGGLQPYSYEFTVNGEEVEADGASCSFKAEGAGSCTVALTVTDANGETASFTGEAVNVLALPGKVTGLSVEQPELGVATLNLSWTAVEGAESYKVYQYQPDNNEEPWAEIAEVSETTLEVKNLPLNKEYQFYVTACVTALRGEVESERGFVELCYLAEQLTLIAPRTTLAVGEQMKLEVGTASGTIGEYQIYEDEGTTGAVVFSEENSCLLTAAAPGKVVLTVRPMLTDAGAASIEIEIVDAPTQITPSIDAIVLPVGGTETLTYETDNGNIGGIEITIDDPEVISLDENGKITALKPGSAVIHIQSYMEEVYADVTVTVLPHPDAISLSAETDTLYVGNRLQLKVELEPDNAYALYAFKSSNEDVATVDKDGVVRGVSAGEVIIQVTTYNAMVASLGLTVEELPVEFYIEDQEDGSVFITGVEGELEGTLFIPAEIDGKPVKAIADHAFRDRGDVTSVVIAAGVELIGDWAFWNCPNLESVEIETAAAYSARNAGGLRVIGSRAFAECDSLTSFVVPEGVETIGDRAFAYNDNLTSLTVPASVTEIGDEILEGCNFVIVTVPEGNSAIKAYAEEYGICYTDGKTTSLHVFQVVEVDERYDVHVGESVTWAADMVGGDGNYQFLYELRNSFGVAYNEPEWTTDATFTYEFADTGIYNMTISVKDGSGSQIDGVDCVRSVYVSQDNADGTYRYVILNEEEKTAMITVIFHDRVSGDVTLPTELDGYTIIAIDRGAFYGDDDVTSVTIPEGYLAIGRDVFAEMPSLRSVSLPSTLTEISDNAFWHCAIESITIPGSVTAIQSCAFADCYNLTEVHFEGAEHLIHIYNQAFWHSSLESVTIPSNAKIYPDVFAECHNLEEAIVSENVTSLGQYAFANCGGLKTVYLPTSMETLGEGVFDNCHQLSEVHGLEYVREIRCGAFNGCSSLGGANISSATDIEYDAFLNCHSLSWVELGNGLETIPQNCFNNCHSLNSINLPDDLKSIDNWAFVNCHSLGFLDLTGRDISFGENVFGGTNVTLLVDIGSSAYHYAREWGVDYIPVGEANNSQLHFELHYDEENDEHYAVLVGYGAEGEDYIELEGVLTIPDSITHDGITYPVTEIAGHAIRGYHYLTGVVIPDSVHTIGEWAFGDNHNLAEITIGSGVETIEVDAFNSCNSLEEVVIPANVTFLGGGAFANCENLLSIIFEADADVEIDFHDDCLLDNSPLVIVHCAPGSAAEAYAIRRGIPYNNGEFASLAIRAVRATRWAGEIGHYAEWEVLYNGNDVEFLYELLYNGEIINTEDEDVWTKENTFGWECTEVGVYDLDVYAREAGDDENVVHFCSPDFMVISKGAEDESGWRYTYQHVNEDGTIDIGITGYDGELEDGVLSIPETIDGNPVATIMFDAFSGRDDIRRVELSKHIFMINGGAFANCHNLESFDFGEAEVKVIDEWAFSNCHSLREIDLPDSVLAIYDNAFRDAGLTAVRLPASLKTMGMEVFRGCGDLAEVDTSALTELAEIGGFAFVDCDSLTEIVLPDCVTSTSYDAFYDCDQLQKVTLGKNFETLAPCTFMNCHELREINLPDSLKDIGGSAFEHCCNLRSVVIPDSVETMGHRVFFQCYSLQSAVMSNALTETGIATFEDCHRLASVTLPENLQVINSWAFKNCHRLLNVQIPASVTRIENNAFENCGSLGVIDLTALENLEFIDGSAFENSNAVLRVNIGSYAHDYAVEHELEYIPVGEADASPLCYYHENDYIVINGYDGTIEGTLEIPSHIEDTPVAIIDGSAFQGQDRMTKVIIPDTVEQILGFAFQNCRRLETIEFGDSLKEIQEHAFQSCESLISVYIPDGVEYIGHNAFSNCPLLQDLHIPASVERFDDRLIDDSQRCVLYVEKGSVAETYAIDNDLTYDNGEVHPFKVMEIYDLGWTDVVGDWSTWSAYVTGDHAAQPWQYNYILYRGDEMIKDFGWSEDPTISYTYEEGGDYTMSLAVKDADGNVTDRYFDNDVNIIGWEEEEGMFRYNYVGENEIKITSVTEIRDGRLEIPAEIEGNTVVGLAPNAVHGREELEWVLLPGTLRFIDDWAFAYCHNLQGILSLNEDGEEVAGMAYTQLEYIGRNVFDTCENLDNVVLPETLREIHDEAFWDCHSLQEITLPASLRWFGDRCFAECHNLRSVTINSTQLEEIDSGVFAQTHSLQSIVIPEGVKIIRDEAFYESGIASVSFPSTLETIDDRAFALCGNLEELTIPDRVTYIGYDCFPRCYELKKVTLGSGIETIQDWAFMNCHNLQEINLGDCKNLTYIGESAFEECHSLQEIVIPESVEYFGIRLFYNCYSLEKAVMKAACYLEVEVVEENGEKWIDEIYTTRWATFENCHNLRTVVLPDNLNSIANWAFQNCHRLENINVPSGLEGIGEYAFSNCHSLREFTLDGDIYNIEGGVFDGCDATLYVYPDTYAFDRVQETDWNYCIIGAEADDNGIQYVISNGGEGDQAIIVGYEGDLVGDLEIPATYEHEGKVYPVTVIYDWAFCGQDRLMNLTIPANVMYIGNGAFADCWRLRTVSIAEGSQIDEIGSEAFERCNNLNSINIEAAEGLKIIGERAFAECHSLESLTFPATVEEIGAEITDGCPLILFYVTADSAALEYARGNGIAYRIAGNDDFDLCLQYVGINEYASFPGETATWRAYTIGGSNVQYKYRLYRASEYVTETDWVSEDTFSYTFEENGCYMVGVTVRSDNGDGTYTYYPLDENGEPDQKFADGHVVISESDDNTLFNYSILEHNEEEGIYQVFITGWVENDEVRLEGDITIPAVLTIDGQDYDVVEILDEAFGRNESITGITVEEGIQRIGYGAFRDMPELRYLDLPSTLEEVTGEMAAYCRNLEEVTIRSADRIEDCAFIECENLHTVNLPENGSLYRIGHRAFACCWNLKNIKLPAGLEEIGDRAFSECHQMEIDLIPNSVRMINNNAFEFCHSIHEMLVYAGLEDIGEDIFHDTNVYVIAPSDAPILEYCLDWGYDFEANGPADNSRLFGSLEEDGFWITGYDGRIIGDLEIPATFNINGEEHPVTAIYDGALADQDGMMSVSIPASVRFIGDRAFVNCDRLREVLIEEGSQMAEIGAYAFAYCELLHNVDLHNVSEAIGECAFIGCVSLNELTIAETVTQMGEDIFEECRYLRLNVSAGSTAHDYAIEYGIPFNVGEGYALSVLSVDVEQWAENGEVGDEVIWNVTAIGGAGGYQYQYQLYRNGEFYGEPSEWTDSYTFAYEFTEAGVYRLYARVKDGAGTVSENKRGWQSMFISLIDEESGLHVCPLTEDTAMIAHAEYQEGDVVIPETLLGYTIVEIAPYAFQYQGDIESITLPETVGFIGEYAFIECGSLRTVNLPASLTGIGDRAFFCCWDLENIELPDGLITLQNGVFVNCESLEEISIPDSVTNIGDVMFAGCRSLKSVKLPAGMTEIQAEFFADCESLEAIEIPKTVTWIGAFAFGGCASLTEVTIPASVKTIGDEAFAHCGKIETLNLTSGLEYIGAGAFMNNASLKSLILPDTVTRVRGQAFDGCGSLETLVLSQNLEHVTNWCFAHCGALNSVTIPESVMSIGDYAFSEAINMTEVILPANGKLEQIGQSAFFNNESLTSIVIPDTVKEIGPIAFDSCYALESVTLPDQLTKLADFTFANCHSLKSIVIPDSVKHIGRAVFAENYALESITLPAGLESLGWRVFYKSAAFNTLFVPSTVHDFGEEVFAETSEDLVIYVSSEDDPIAQYAESCGLNWLVVGTEQTYEVYTFATNDNATGAIVTGYTGDETSVVVPEIINGMPVVEIGDGAFENNATMTAIDLPDTVEVIGARAFANCTSLASMC